MNKLLKSSLQKIGVESLNKMQEEAYLAITSFNEIILLSPTGTGKTLAFLIPIIEQLDVDCKEIQALIVVPTRELAIQIEQVVRNMATGFKVNAVYGGRAGSKDKSDLKHIPAILIGTPGRLADRFERDGTDLSRVKSLVLDEFDKSLDIGYENEMKKVLNSLKSLKSKILTSATNNVSIPMFVGLKDPKKVNYLKEHVESELEIKVIETSFEEKEKTVDNLLRDIGNQSGIVFCNFKTTISSLSEYLVQNNIPHGCFYGGMEQRDREKALIKFRNGTYQTIIATDLAARGLDIPELKYIIHYELPQRLEEYTHRNGRTARMKKNGKAYLIKNNNKSLPYFIKGEHDVENVLESHTPIYTNWRTLYINGGRKDKISKGDIAGLFLKQGGLQKGDLGIIELKNDCSYVAINKEKIDKLITVINNQRLKKKKIRVKEI